VTRACAVLAALACGCAGALAIGPTIDARGVVRLEGAASGGVVPGGNDVSATGDPDRGAIGVVSIGIRIALAAGTRWSYAQGSISGYVEYARLGTASSPWGFHVGLAIGSKLARRAEVIVGLYGGPDHLAHAHTFDTGDGYATTFATDGVELSVRGMPASGSGRWWQLGAMYVRRGTELYE